MHSPMLRVFEVVRIQKSELRSHLRRIFDKSAALLKRHRVFRGSLLVSVAILGGAAAQEAAEAWALRKWEYSHGPSSLIWKAVLENEGYSAYTNEFQIHRLLRTLPSAGDPDGRIWVSTNAEKIVVFPDSSLYSSAIAPAFEETLIYSFGPPSSSNLAHLPDGWIPVARPNWTGFEKFKLYLNQHRPAPRPQVSAPIQRSRNPRIYIDPREIRY